MINQTAMVKNSRIFIAISIGMLLINMVKGTYDEINYQANSKTTIGIPMGIPVRIPMLNETSQGPKTNEVSESLDEKINRIKVETQYNSRSNDYPVELYGGNDSECNVMARGSLIGIFNIVAALFMEVHPILLLPQVRAYGMGEGEAYQYQGLWFTISILDWAWTYVFFATMIGCFKPQPVCCLFTTFATFLLALNNLIVFLIDYFQGGNLMWLPVVFIILQLLGFGSKAK